LIEKSKKYLQGKGLKRYEIEEQSIMNMKFPDDSFDFVITRLVLEHLPDPIGATKEVYRVLRPGGKAVFVDNDFEMHLRCYPDIPELNQLYDAYCRARISEGGNPKIGRELPDILKKCHFRNVDLEIIVAHSEIVGDDIFIRSEGSGIPAKLVEDGYMTNDLFDRIARKWFELMQNENHALFRQLFIAGGEKILVQQSQSTKPDIHDVPSQDISLQKDIPENEIEQRQFVENYVLKLIAGLLNTSASREVR